MNYDSDFFRQAPRLAALAQAGCLYQVAQKSTATVAVGAQVCLFNNTTSPKEILVFSARVAVSVAMEISGGIVFADPALGAGNAPNNMHAGYPASAATWEQAAGTSFAPVNTFTDIECVARTLYEMVAPGTLWLPRGSGVGWISGLVASDAIFTLLWAEVDGPVSDYIDNITVD